MKRSAVARREARVLRPFKRPVTNGSAAREPSTTSETSCRMGRVRQRGTSPELVVRRLLRQSGLRYTLRNCDLPGSPDLANRRRRFAVFVHGCFWHQHPGCPNATIPKRNREFWLAKFAANRERDARSIRELEHLGYTVFIVWECETRSSVAFPDRLALRRVRGRGNVVSASK